MTAHFNLTDAELTIMKELWRTKTPMPSAEIADRLHSETGWSFSTVSTLLGRMVEKGSVGYEKRGKAYYYSPLFSEQAYRRSELRQFLGKLYDGSVHKLLAELVDNHEMTREDLDALRKQFHLDE